MPYDDNSALILDRCVVLIGKFQLPKFVLLILTTKTLHWENYLSILYQSTYKGCIFQTGFETIRSFDQAQLVFVFVQGQQSAGILFAFRQRFDNRNVKANIPLIIVNQSA